MWPALFVVVAIQSLSRALYYTRKIFKRNFPNSGEIQTGKNLNSPN